METTGKNERDIFDEDPEQNLRIENEILQLKLQAERGGYYCKTNEDLPPEIEAQFLKNIRLFEQSFDNAKEMTIYECIGRPLYKKVNELNAAQVKIEIKKIMDLLHSRNIILEVLGQYDLSVIYKFITEELFNQKIRDVSIPGYITTFIYEEFHPNHHLAIGETAQQFLTHWFEKSFDENSSEFAGQIVTGYGKIFSKEEVITRLCNCLNHYQSFLNIKFAGSDTSFEWNEEEKSGIGHAEGIFSYDAELENNEIIQIKGPYKLYMINEYGLWKIFFFEFPGFAWG